MIKIKYCENCGEEIFFDTNICPNCKKPLNVVVGHSEDNSVKISVWGIVLSIIPILGWIFGYKGLKKANLYNNSRAKTLSIIAICLATLVFFVNLYLTANGYIEI